jgi:hypothetical protein
MVGQRTEAVLGPPYLLSNGDSGQYPIRGWTDRVVTSHTSICAGVTQSFLATWPFVESSRKEHG